MFWSLNLPEGFRELTIVINTEHEDQILDSYGSLGCEWKDGTSLEDWKPSEHGASFPYYLGMESDGDVFYREMSDITVVEESDIDERLDRMMSMADRINEIVEEMKARKAEILTPNPWTK